MSETNPNGANKNNPDPRQAKFLANYIDPESDTFGDTYNSAKEAGYSDSYAKNIVHLMPEWLSKNIEEQELVSQAKKNLKNFLERKEEDKIKFDATKFTLERVAREMFGRNVDVTSQGEQITPDEVKVEIVENEETEPESD